MTATSVAVADAASPPTAVTGPPSAVEITSAVIAGNADPNGTSTSWYFEYGTSPAYGLRSAVHALGAGSATLAVSTSLTGLTPGTAYHYRLIATSSGGTAVGGDQSFSTPAIAPVIMTTAVTHVRDASVQVNGTIDPEGLAGTWYVQYGTTAGYGSSTAVRSAGSGTAAVTVAVTLVGLAPHSSYSYEIVATNAAGSRLGGDHAFSTTGPPVVTTGAPTDIHTTSATLTGSVDPDGHGTSWHFEYGLTIGYGLNTPAQGVGSGTAAVGVAKVIADLLPGTLYHFRLVATSADGTSLGSDGTLTTPGPTLNSSSTSVVFGRAVVLSGTVPDGKADETVSVYAQALTEGSFVGISSVLTGNGGAWVYAAQPNIETSYKVLWDGEVSPSLSIGVEPSVSLRAAPGGAFATRVTADHGFARRVVRLQRRVHGTWRTIASMRLDRQSRATFHPSLPLGLSRLRVYLTAYQAGSGYLAGYSAVHNYRRP